MSKDLYLPVNREYFEQIDRGEKPDEFRLQTPFWKKRIHDREYDTVTIALGYPKKDDASRRITFRWDGARGRTITHPHFGPDPVSVYAISLRGERL